MQNDGYYGCKERQLRPIRFFTNHLIDLELE